MPPQIPIEQSPHKHNRLVLLAVMMILLGILAVGYFWYQSESKNLPLESQTPVVATSTVDQFADWKIYRNKEYGFEFKYTQDFLVGKYKPEVNSVGGDLGWNNAVVLVESQLIDTVLLSKEQQSFSLDTIPVGEISTISIRLITTSADFYRRNFINKYKTWGGKEMKIGEYIVTKLPEYPGPYGDTAYYYLLPISDNLIIEFTGHKQRFSMSSMPDAITNESHYDRVIENIISTFKFISTSTTVQ